MERRKKLVVISHTEHYYRQGALVGWGPTLNELSYLAQYWDEVVHLACLHPEEAPESALPYTAANIRYVPLPAYGGPRLRQKLGIIGKMPRIIRAVRRELKGATEVQFRSPTAMGLLLLPLFTWVWSRPYRFWVKYAGDWEQERPPRSNGWQRWFLQQRWIDYPVTINGFWPGQQPHCHSFENPCLHEADLQAGAAVAAAKDFSVPLRLCFVGRICPVKGLDRIMEAIRQAPSDRIDSVHILGDGPDRARFEAEAATLAVPVHFHGHADRVRVHRELAAAHLLLLPSSNEGFPKVVAEAACYGTVPVVSDVSALKHYLNDQNAFVWPWKGEAPYADTLRAALIASPEVLAAKSATVRPLAQKFTFAHYYRSLCEKVFVAPKNETDGPSKPKEKMYF